ncbi:MAG TPA: hypothetical protein VHW23_33415 [Kofleriaceae bacterium]|jgi:dipeptide/tripeptide permease|nr:hypothetical protein [Kofleriaceae bacterium]
MQPALVPEVATAPVARIPRQLPFIIANEGCERFSFYGMRNVLTMYLSATLLAYLPDAERKIAHTGLSTTAFYMFFFAGFACVAAVVFGLRARHYREVDHYRV